MESKGTAKPFMDFTATVGSLSLSTKSLEHLKFFNIFLVPFYTVQLSLPSAMHVLTFADDSRGSASGIICSMSVFSFL